MLLNPFKHLNLVLEAIVQTTTFANLSARQEAIRTNAVIKGDNDNAHISRLDQASSIVIGISINIKAATLNKDVDG